MATSNLSTLERLYSLRELDLAGYGNRQTLNRLINDGRIPATKIGNGYKIRESDLHLLREAVGKPLADDAYVRDLTIGDYVKALVDTFPKLNDEQKNELGRLLSPAA